MEYFYMLITADSPQPQREQFKEDYQGWREHFKAERKKFSLFSCLTWWNIIGFLSSYFFDTPERWYNYGIGTIVFFLFLLVVGGFVAKYYYY